MTRKEIIRELIALVLGFILLGLLDILINQWGNLPNNVNWLDYDVYSSSTLAVVLICSRTLYVYLPSKVNRWLYPLLIAGIWGMCSVVISLICLGHLDTKGIMLPIGFGFFTALLRKYMPASLMNVQRK